MASASAADTRRALRELAAERNGGKKGGWVFWIVLLAAILALLFGGIGWALGWFTTPKAVAEFKALVDQQITDLDKMARNEKPYSESFDSMRPMFEKMRDLPREVREEQMSRLFEARSRAEANSYFALPPQQRQAEMDRRLKAEEERRKQWMQRRQQDGNAQAANRPSGQQQNGGRGGPPGGGGGRGGPGGGGGGPPGGGPPGGGRRGGGEDSSNARRLAGINRTSPDDRARQTEYRRLRDEARARSGGGGGGR